MSSRAIPRRRKMGKTPMVTIQARSSPRLKSLATNPAIFPSTTAFIRMMPGNVSTATRSINGQASSSKHFRSSLRSSPRSRKLASTMSNSLVNAYPRPGFDGSRRQKINPAARFSYEITGYFSRDLTKSLSILVNSIGKMYLVDAPCAMFLRVSKYCRVMVLESTVWATPKIFSSANA